MKKDGRRPKKTATLYNSDVIDKDIIMPSNKELKKLAKDCVKNANKTQRVIGRPFTKENQPEKKGRPLGSKDAVVYFDKAFKGDSREIVANQIVEIINDQETPQASKIALLKLLAEYLYNKPTQTIENINRELKIVVDTEEHKNDHLEHQKRLMKGVE